MIGPAKSAPCAPEAPAPSLGLVTRRRDAVALAAALAVLAVFFAPAFQPSVEFGHRDGGRLHLPAKAWLAQEYGAGRFPEWLPHAGLGVPVIGNAILATLHPFNALLLVLPPSAALTAWVLLSVALAAAGAFAWARALGLGPAGGAAAAIAFALSGPIVSSTDNVTYLTTYAALPWVLAAAQLCLRGPSPGRLALVGTASTLCAAGGDPQAWGMVVALLPAYGAASSPAGGRLRGAGLGAAAAGVAILAAAPVIFPVLAWMPESSRAAGLSAAESTRWNLHPARLAELFLPGLFAGDGHDATSVAFWYLGNRWTIVPWFASVYLGVTVLALAGLGIARDRRIRAFALAAVPLTWAALGHYGGFDRLVGHVPLLGALRYQEKLLVWPALAMAVAAAAGIDALASGPPRRRTRALGAAAAGLLLLALGAAVVPQLVGPPAPDGPAGVLLRNLTRGAAASGCALALLAAVAAGAARLGRAAPLAACAAVALDLLASGSHGYFLYPRDPEAAPPLAAAIAHRGGAAVAVLAPDNDARWPGRGRTRNLHEWGRRTLSACWNLPLGIRNTKQYVGLPDGRWATLVDEVRGREAALALFGFGFLVVASTDDAARAGAPPPWDVVADLELPAFAVALRARPRAYVASVAERADEAAALAFAASGGTPGLAVFEGDHVARAARADGVTQLEIDEPDRVELLALVLSDGAALVVLNDLFAPGWTARVDGVEAPIVRANYAVRGVFVPPGTHRVTFAYETPGLAAGATLSLAGAAALLAWWAARRLAARRR